MIAAPLGRGRGLTSRYRRRERELVLKLGDTPASDLGVRRMRGRLRGQSFRGRGVRAPFHKPGDQLDGFLAKVASYAMEI